ncbi:hypothetical protein A0H81_13008 [Grifola frondosa]|uniref:Uncharacterized protein n=1 Tax=Grifola frondosa TaxID=5627 RepID=A0A1C7LT29_GRIFR|nr:hypothetical protein A0H81_13008 [Grifola frondosa]
MSRDSSSYVLSLAFWWVAVTEIKRKRLADSCAEDALAEAYPDPTLYQARCYDLLMQPPWLQRQGAIENADDSQSYRVAQ